jgi:hypothetical protein
MSTIVKNAPKKAVKKVNIFETQYGQKVLNVNKGMKNEFNSTGGAIKFILVMGKDVAPKEYLAELRKIQKNDNLYKAFDSVVRTTAKGKQVRPTPFRVLQTLYANLKK